MRIAFFADTHLGYGTYNKTTDEGVNVRVQDGYNAFSEIIDGIIRAHEESPFDMVIHGGDLFHSPTPDIRTVVYAQKEIIRLARATSHIPQYYICGNHEFSDDIHMLSSTVALSTLGDYNVHALVDPVGKYRVGDVTLHSITHKGVLLGEDLYKHISPDKDAFNMLLAHGAAWDKDEKLHHCMNSPRELILPKHLVTSEAYSERLDILCLGHIHSRLDMSENCFYTGSALRRGFSDSPGERGWTEIVVDNNGNWERMFHNIYQRPQYDVVLDSSDGVAKLAEELKAMESGAIVRATIECPRRVQGVIRQEVSTLDTSRFLSFQFRSRVLDNEKKEKRESADVSSGVLQSWKTYCDQREDAPIKLAGGWLEDAYINSFDVE